jgi:CHASE3 domain sensor protein
MKIFKKIIVLNLLILMLIVTAGVFSYNSYNIYVQENKTHKSVHLSTFLDKLIYLLEKVDDERVNSNTYLASSQHPICSQGILMDTGP